jgi:hypothetical protein
MIDIKNQPINLAERHLLNLPRAAHFRVSTAIVAHLSCRAIDRTPALPELPHKTN